MSKRTPKSRSKLIAKYKVEARRLAGTTTHNECRFISVGLAKGSDLEPAGPMAGANAAPMNDQKHD